jgi:uncharacterized protein (TIGR02271 family)
MLSETQAREIIGNTAYDNDGDKIGKVGQLFLDDETGQPEFVTVNTGLFGNKETFIPVANATLEGDRLVLPFDKDKVKNAPNVDAEGGHLDRPEEQRLFEYYGMGYGTSAGQGRGHDDLSTSRGNADLGTGVGNGLDTDRDNDRTGTGSVGGNDFIDRDRDSVADSDRGGRTVGHDTSGPTTDDAMTRSEENLRVGTTSEESGRARLRKYVTTEQETVTVPVTRERAVIETEPITDANVGDATSGRDLSEEEHEVVLNEERVVVDKEVTPVERVRLGKETVTEQKTVTEDVSKEHIETDGDIDTRGTDRT